MRFARFLAATCAAPWMALPLVGCESLRGGGEETPPQVEAPGLDRAALRQTADAIFGPLPEEVPKASDPATEARIALGRMLYFEPRLSRNHDVSCNSCHGLDTFGQDNQPSSPGHRGQRGDRSSPSVYNAALHVAQFWDGRAVDVEEQAKGPVLNPIEMASRDEAEVVAVLRSIPGYVDAFESAFPEADEPVSYDHMADAIGAFERRLTTPGRFDDFMAGDLDALDPAELRGLQDFVQTGCVTCHAGPAVGGTMYRKLGLVVPYETEDVGRFAVTGEDADRFVFKVPSLRNIAETAPYFHDGSVATLVEAVDRMAKHQLGIELDVERNASIRAFLEALTGRVDAEYTAAPALPPSGPDTPAPDPS